MRQLDPKTHYAFRVLSKNARPDDVKHFLTQASSFIKPSDKNNADAVLQVSIAANRTLYDEIRRESDMCQAMAFSYCRIVEFSDDNCSSH